MQAYLFVVPEGSSQTTITAEEAYFVFGFGTTSGVVPWVDQLLMFIRPITTSTLLTMAANIGVPGAKWKGEVKAKSAEVLSAVATSLTPEATIGILGAEVYDGARATTNSLAFRAYHQFHAYYADSTAAATDKKNVRDGHYTIWSPTVWLTHVDGGGVPTNAAAKYVIDLILGLAVTPTNNFEALDIVVGLGLVPECAMEVTRSRVDVTRGAVSGALELDGNTVACAAARLISAVASWRWLRADEPLPLVQVSLGMFKLPFGREIPELTQARVFLEPTVAGRALFPGDYDLGLRVSGARARCP